MGQNVSNKTKALFRLQIEQIRFIAQIQIFKATLCRSLYFCDLAPLVSEL